MSTSENTNFTPRKMLQVSECSVVGAILETIDGLFAESRRAYQSSQGQMIVRAGGAMDALFDVRAAIDEVLKASAHE